MSDKRKERNGTSPRGYRRVIYLAASLTVAMTATASAEYVSSDWALSPGLSVTGAGRYHERNGVASQYNLLVATAELEFSSPSRPWYGGLFADYRRSTSPDIVDQVNLGAYLRYDLPLWDFTGYVFNHRAVGDAGTAMFAGRIRYRIRGDNKIGLEYMRTLGNSDFADATVAYYGSLSESLSFNVGVGRGFVGGPDLQARIELTWQVR